MNIPKMAQSLLRLAGEFSTERLPELLLIPRCSPDAADAQWIADELSGGSGEVCSCPSERGHRPDPRCESRVMNMDTGPQWCCLGPNRLQGRGNGQRTVLSRQQHLDRKPTGITTTLVWLLW